MVYTVRWSGLVFLSLLSCVQIFAKSPSGEIPERREFPLNPSVSPCDDFHAYVCSKVEANFKLRDDRSRHMFAFNDSTERLLLKKRAFFKTLASENISTLRGMALKQNYLSCIDVKARKREEQSWLAQLKKEIYASGTVEAFQRWLVDNIKVGRPQFLQFQPIANNENPLIYDLIVGTEFMSLPEQSYYENKELMLAFEGLVTQFFKIEDPDQKDAERKKRVARLLDFERDFAKVFPKLEVRRQRLGEKRTLTQSEFFKKYAKFDLKKALDSLPPGLLIRDIYPEAMEFYRDRLTIENLPVLQDFLFFHAGSAQMDEAYPGFMKAQLAFAHRYFGEPKTRPVLEERCTMAMMEKFPREIDEILLPRIFKDFPVDDFLKLASKVRETIAAGIEHNEWLSSDAKKEASEKIKTARLQLVKPANEKEWDFNPQATYSADHPIQNEEILSAALFKKDMDLIKEPVDPSIWGMSPLEVNAQYNPTSNRFTLPIGILQFPFFDAKADLINNLGSVGAVIGHELGHAIDDSGSRYDHKGVVRQWMSLKDLSNFSKRTERLVGEFEKIKHNGRQTLGENVADLVGVTFAYKSAFPNPEMATREDQKKFFLSYGRVWCAVVRPQMEEKLLKTDVHALWWARINEPIKHQKGFIDAFQCKPGDKMYLSESDRVSVW